ncbi:MAG TPA: MarR family winged helix-turn-helix transcriptional regulator [Steroidobacteraceae bacterium]|nr:MarR family winged helix-turn-helix transcriptional regulator [Steroidobacteraceae bacterium]
MPRNGLRRTTQRGAAEPARSVGLAPLMGYVGYAVRRAQIAIFGDFLESLREVELRPAQFGVLVVIGDNPGMRQSEVCAGLGIQKANFVPLISELEARGLVVREPGATDRRSYALHLTAQGEALLRRARELHAKHEARLTDRIGRRGRAQLLVLLNRLADGHEDR